jgi:hypothetical protein
LLIRLEAVSTRTDAGPHHRSEAFHHLRQIAPGVHLDAHRRGQKLQVHVVRRLGSPADRHLQVEAERLLLADVAEDFPHRFRDLLRDGLEGGSERMARPHGACGDAQRIHKLRFEQSQAFGHALLGDVPEADDDASRNRHAEPESISQHHGDHANRHGHAGNRQNDRMRGSLPPCVGAERLETLAQRFFATLDPPPPGLVVVAPQLQRRQPIGSTLHDPHALPKPFAAPGILDHPEQHADRPGRGDEHEDRDHQNRIEHIL